MKPARQATPGTARVCPHCKATILESASVCPVCRHHLRFDPNATERRPTLTPLRVEGTIRHPSVGEPWEYTVMLSIRNDRGEEVVRQVVGVGALQPSEQRTFTLAVDVFAPGDTKPPQKDGNGRQ